MHTDVPMPHRVETSLRPPLLPVVSRQSWRDMLFLHPPVPTEVLRAHVPASLELDEFVGTAWTSTLPFCLERVGAPIAPAVLSFGFLEVNLRTYVHSEGRVH